MIERIKIIVPRIIITLRTITDNGNDVKLIIPQIGRTFQSIIFLGHIFPFSIYNNNNNDKLKSEILKALDNQLELLKKKEPEEYKNILKFIDNTIKNKNNIIAEWDKALSNNNQESILSLMFNGKASLLKSLWQSVSVFFL